MGESDPSRSASASSSVGCGCGWAGNRVRTGGVCDSNAPTEEVVATAGVADAEGVEVEAEEKEKSEGFSGDDFCLERDSDRREDREAEVGGAEACSELPDDRCNVEDANEEGDANGAGGGGGADCEEGGGNCEEREDSELEEGGCERAESERVEEGEEGEGRGLSVRGSSSESESNRTLFFLLRCFSETWTDRASSV